MLKQRVMTAAIGLPSVIGIFAFGPKWLLILIFLIFVGISAFEAAPLLIPRMSKIFSVAAGKTSSIRDEWFQPLAVVLALILFVASSASPYQGAHGMLVVALIGVMVLGLFSSHSIEIAMGRSAALLMTVCYSSLPWLAIWDLYLMGDGSPYVMFLLAVVWSGDTGAYFGGLKFGRHKLAPTISPKKTWEGAIFGLLASALGGFLIHKFYSITSKPLGHDLTVLAASLAGGILGQMGDLFESLFKRFAGVKDSGSIFPGHGGFLDRVDGLLFAAPVIWFIFHTFQV